MRSKAPLALMEQLVMLLVFSLAAALCVQAFAVADRISRAGEERDQAVIAVQTAAETVKAFAGSLEEAAAHMGGQYAQGLWYMELDQDWNILPTGEQGVYRLCVQGMPSGTAGLGMAQIWAEKAEETVYALDVAWQEVDGDA